MYKCISDRGEVKLIKKETKKVVATHSDMNSCMRQMKALYANMPKKEKEMLAMKERLANQ